MLRISAIASVIGRGQRTFAFLLDLLYPPRCGGCGKYGEGWWCTACNNRTQWLNARDSRVSLELPSGQSLTVISAANFGPPLREGIHCFKYEGQPQLAEAFAAHMSAIAKANALSADGIVPVPLHATRLKERGFNQSLLLARHISAALGRPVEARALQRIRPTQQQAHLSATARKENMRGAFAALPERVQGRALMLVDDVLTTGATLVECAHVLYEAGAQHVVALTLARA
ncbi:ComF family protein [Candidatus Roseilinea sp. NK_OTU-006]|uniref:ComF family protein n=1 Tax=Candidatus Roseilinea sp. NK_OTU-006 TaxID=2704250 RepID=UPI00145D09AB|nr:ComF family protein [Candidatus Roseilinea sp. NK_OTU-006]